MVRLLSSVHHTGNQLHPWISAAMCKIDNKVLLWEKYSQPLSYASNTAINKAFPAAPKIKRLSISKLRLTTALDHCAACCTGDVGGVAVIVMSTKWWSGIFYLPHVWAKPLSGWGCGWLRWLVMAGFVSHVAAGGNIYLLKLLNR